MKRISIIAVLVSGAALLSACGSSQPAPSPEQQQLEQQRTGIKDTIANCMTPLVPYLMNNQISIDFADKSTAPLKVWISQDTLSLGDGDYISARYTTNLGTRTWLTFEPGKETVKRTVQDATFDGSHVRYTTRSEVNSPFNALDKTIDDAAQQCAFRPELMAAPKPAATGVTL